MKDINNSKHFAFSISNKRHFKVLAWLQSKKFSVTQSPVFTLFDYCFVTNRTSTVTERRKEERSMANQRLRKSNNLLQDEEAERPCKEEYFFVRKHKHNRLLAAVVGVPIYVRLPNFTPSLALKCKHGLRKRVWREWMPFCVEWDWGETLARDARACPPWALHGASYLLASRNHFLAGKET